MSEQSDLIKKMEEMIKNPTISEKMRKVFQERLEKLKNVDDNSTNYKQTNLNSSTQSGMTLFGQFRAKKERVAGSNGPSSFCIRVINNKKMNYWVS